MARANNGAWHPFLAHHEELLVQDESHSMQLRNTLAPLGTFVRRRAKRPAGALALTSVTLGGLLMATALPAYGGVSTNTYTIGAPSGAVGAVAASPGSVGEGALTNFAVTFDLPAALSGPSDDSVTVTPSTALASVPANIDIVGGSCIQAGTGGMGGAGRVSTTAVTIELSSSCSLSAGQNVEVGFAADAPSTTGTMYFDVSTSKNATPASSNSVTIVVARPQLSAASAQLGANTTYSVTGVPVASLSSGQTTLKLTVGVTSGAEAITLYGGTAGYTVAYTPASGTATKDAVTSVALRSTNHAVTLTLATAVANGGVLNITAKGTNPAASGASQSDEMSVEPGNGTSETSNGITFGQSVTGVSVSPSSWVAGASSNYFVSFKASDAIPDGGAIFLTELAGQTGFTTVTAIEVSDTTHAWHFVATDPTLANGLAKIPLSHAVTSGDSLTVLVVGATNPPAGTVNDFAVFSSFDTVPVDAPPYMIGGGVGVNVSVSPSSAGSLATYVISDLYASAAMSAGSRAITLDAPAGTTFPSSPAEYSVQDATTPSGSGTITSAVTGGGTNDVSFEVPGNISEGDRLTVTVIDVINPSTASSTYTIGLGGAVTGPSTAGAPFPHAPDTFPNGAIINFSGKDYVLGGGHAFEITSPKIMTALQKVDHATVVTAAAGAKPPSGAPRQGTLLFTRPVNGAATIFVVGSDGELHGFVSPKQFKDDGYDPALVVTVPSLSGLKMGRSAGAVGAAANAFGTSSDGAIIDSGGTYYVFGGGRAFLVPNSAELSGIRRADKAQTLSGHVTTAQEGAGIASGVELSAPGRVYVTYQGSLYPFKSISQLRADGYGGTAAMPVPGTAGLPVAASYSGS